MCFLKELDALQNLVQEIIFLPPRCARYCNMVINRPRPHQLSGKSLQNITKGARRRPASSPQPSSLHTGSLLHLQLRAFTAALLDKGRQEPLQHPHCSPKRCWGEAFPCRALFRRTASHSSFRAHWPGPLGEVCPFFSDVEHLLALTSQQGHPDPLPCLLHTFS